MPTINALNVTLIAISRSPLGSPTARRSTLFADRARVARSCAAELRRTPLALAVVRAITPAHYSRITVKTSETLISE